MRYTALAVVITFAGVAHGQATPVQPPAPTAPALPVQPPAVSPASPSDVVAPPATGAQPTPADTAPATPSVNANSSSLFPNANQNANPSVQPPPRQRPQTQRQFGRLARVPEMFGDFFGSSPSSAFLFGDPEGEGGGFDDLAVPGPGTGGAVVGRQKIGENGSPLPRDRVFFNYSYFDSVPFTSQGVDVNRFTPGVEKTFLDGNMSLEVRLPFATTLDSDIVSDGPTGTSAAEFGNITMYLKALLAQDGQTAIGSGLGLVLPTADSLTISQTDGTPQAVVSNEAVHLMPYVGMVRQSDASPMFVQGFLQFDFDLNGNPVYADGGGGGLNAAGIINDVSYLFADIAVGWWIDGDPHATITSIVPTIELHYNRSLQDTDFVAAGGFQIGNDAETIELLNAVIATSFYMGPSKRIGVGYATPLGGGFDQQFDGELRVTFDSYFGR